MKRVFVWLSAIVLSVGLVACQQVEEEVLPTIAEIAVEAGIFQNLVAALTEAELVETFANADAGPFTVFAPTDLAFAALIAFVNEAYDLELTGLEDLVEAVGIDYVTDVLTYHVVPGVFMAADVVSVASFNTLYADRVLEVVVDGAVVSVGNDIVFANVVDVDIEASNGVIHVIDFVMVPYLPIQ